LSDNHRLWSSSMWTPRWTSWFPRAAVCAGRGRDCAQPGALDELCARARYPRTVLCRRTHAGRSRVQNLAAALRGRKSRAAAHSGDAARRSIVIPSRPGAFVPPARWTGQYIIEKPTYDTQDNPNFSAMLRALGPRRAWCSVWPRSIVCLRMPWRLSAMTSPWIWWSTPSSPSRKKAGAKPWRRWPPRVSAWSRPMKS